MSTYEPGTTPDELQTLRAEIDALDDRLVDLMARRMELARKTLIPKTREGLPARDPGREATVVRRAAETARARGLEPEPVRDIFWRLIALARRAQESRPAVDGPGAEVRP